MNAFLHLSKSHGTVMAVVMLLVLLPGSLQAAERILILVRGAAGEPVYEQRFAQWTADWSSVASDGGLRLERIGGDVSGDGTHREQLQRAISTAAEASPAELWLVFNGHGTDDGRAARFNLNGPDISARELRDWLAPVEVPTVVIHAGSSSGGFIGALSGPNRVVITATRSSQEQNAARFGGFLAQAIIDERADLDRDGRTSLLEAFLSASRLTAESYETEGRLQTEHALLDDNGDRQGAGGEAFRGIHPIDGGGTELPDGPRAHQFFIVPNKEESNWPESLLSERNALERELALFRARRGSYQDDDAYFVAIEPILVKLAKVYQTAENIGEAAQPAKN